LVWRSFSVYLGEGDARGSMVVRRLVGRMRSLDTIKGEREKTSMKQEERRHSIEVWCL
jgi:hypothetical protein